MNAELFEVVNAENLDQLDINQKKQIIKNYTI